MEKMAEFVKKTETSARDDKQKTERLESKFQKEVDSLILQTRELKVKLSSSRMREEDHLRTIEDM